MKITSRLALLACIFTAAAFPPSTYALTIVPTFDTSITSDPNAASMMAAINLAIAQEQSIILNPITVNIQFKSVNTGLGESSTAVDDLSYSQYRTDLLTNQILSANDLTALASLPATTNNPVNGDPNVHLSLPLLRAIGETTLGDNGGGFDSTVSLNMGLMNFVRTGPQDSNKYDLEQVALHEVQEVLGVGGGGSTLGTTHSSVGSLDLFRYTSFGIRSYTTSASASAYFSIDGGATNLSFFNQTAGGDYSDWNGPANGPGASVNSTAQVQDAFSGPGNQLDLSAAEKTSLDVAGWNIAAVPEPATALMLLTGAGMLAAFQRSRRSGAA